MTQVAEHSGDAPFSDPARYLNPELNQRRTIAAIVDRAMKFGKDVIIDPDGGEIAIKRVRQFARIVPRSGGRIDLEMKLPTAVSTSRLMETRVGRNRLSHYVTLTGPSDFDYEVETWLTNAYDHDGERRRSSRDDE